MSFFLKTGKVIKLYGKTLLFKCKNKLKINNYVVYTLTSNAQGPDIIAIPLQYSKHTSP